MEQSYKQIKQSLGWAQYQVRKDISIRRHWQLVCCAFSFCWWAYRHLPGRLPASQEEPVEQSEDDLPAGSSGRTKKETSAGLLAGGLESGEGMAGTMDDAVALLGGVLQQAPATGAKSAA